MEGIGNLGVGEAKAVEGVAKVFLVEIFLWDVCLESGVGKFERVEANIAETKLKK